MIDPLVSLSIHGIITLLFMFSGIEKLWHRDLFLLHLAEYKLLPQSLVPLGSFIIIGAEILTATLLVVGGSFYGVMTGGLLLGVYTLAILINLLRGRTWMNCGCLGSQGEGLSYWLILRNLSVLATLSLLLLPTVQRSLIWVDYFTLLFSVVAASIAYVVFNTLLTAHTRSKMWWSNP